MTGRAPQPSPSAAQQQAPWAPPPIRNIEDTGLNQIVISDLALKVIYFGGVLTGTRVSEIVKLPWVGVLDGVMEFLKRERLVEVKGTAGGVGEANTQYQITGAGLVKVKELLERSQYAGAAPVTLEQYISAMKAQNRGRITATPEVMKRALSHLVISEKMYSKIGAAVNSGKSMFLYGAPGNGKTTISEAVGRVVLGSDIWIPYAIDVDGQVIRVFDNVNHEVVDSAEADVPSRVGVKRDPRWIRIRRPVIIVGGELTLTGLDLIYDPINKFYEAPYQMKCNGGMFLIDDFGRQQVRPRDLLNRWIVPLEKGIDYLTLATGRKIEIPFNVLIVFSTNIDPADLVDEAFLRRIRHKIEVGDPTPQEFVEIFKRACQAKRVPYDENGLRYLIQEWYLKKERPFRSVHPRDILDQLIDIARYLNRPPVLQPDLIDMACDSYFVQL
ncbi:MAG: AAA family ATPase [Candidatus Thermofonsia Clade 1 bacterium]|jgi:predicted ATPase with chaperone activity|uniref:AAA family ATPase n=1 Tax=Candidatus Thermofonsia Clade 1 bacterium TaxID=2364210 RepID=A0A2M8P2Z1_9CHLR|nr:MAG: AAA family ATPase [Candidatus Thermofonsia Clade 1 bacterium]